MSESKLKCNCTKFQAPEELQQFLSKHKFGQRTGDFGAAQPVQYSHQPLDMLHEEIIRLELSCLDKKKLVKNEKSGCFERDDEVFKTAARFLGLHGPNWLGLAGESLLLLCESIV